MDSVRWGIVSTGRIAHKFARDFSFVPNGKLVAVASRSSEKAERFAAQYGIDRPYGSYEALFEDSTVDAVYVATPHTLHLQNVTDALVAGKAVLCEKPITTTAEDCALMIDVARASGRYLMEALWTYFLPPIQMAARWVGDGRIGALKHVRADFGYPMPFDPSERHYDPELGGGALLDMGIYPIALASLFMGSDPEGVQVLGRRAPNGVDDDVVMVLDYGSAIATLSTSFRCRLPNTAAIVGEEGYILIPDFWCARECRLFRLDEQVDLYVDERAGLGYHYEVEEMNNDLRIGKNESDVVPLEASLGFQRLMDRVMTKL